VVRPLFLFALLIGTGCAVGATVRSSALATGPRRPAAAAPVAVYLTRDPPAGVELGVVEAHGRRPAATLPALLAEFRERVASMGGDRARLDGFATRYELVTETYTYDCGTTEMRTETRTVFRPGPGGTSTSSTETVTIPHHVSRSCTGTRTVEVATLTLTGRAFRARETP
jgi:hypothetical protein